MLTKPQCALTFWTAAFPGLARNLPEVQESSQQVSDGSKTEDDHAHFESMSRNRVSNISFAVSSAGEIIILAIMVGILKGVKYDASTENNTKAFSVIIAFSGGVWCASQFQYRRFGVCPRTDSPMPFQCYVRSLGLFSKNADRVWPSHLGRRFWPLGSNKRLLR